MKKYFTLKGSGKSIIAIITSYIFVILKIFLFEYIFEHIFNFGLSIDAELAISLLCISAPIVVATLKFKFKLFHLAFIIPIIFLLFVIFSPDGGYFLIYKGGRGLFVPKLTKAGGIFVAIEFFIIQTITFTLLKVIPKALQEDKEKRKYYSNLLSEFEDSKKNKTDNENKE